MIWCTNCGRLCGEEFGGLCTLCDKLHGEGWIA